MSAEDKRRSLTLKSIVSQFELPLIVRAATDFPVSNRFLVFNSVKTVSFAFGRVLRTNDEKSIRSKFVAVPIRFSGFFKCLTSESKSKSQVGVLSDIGKIIAEIEENSRSQLFYSLTPIRVYTLAKNDDQSVVRVWEQISADQTILFESLVNNEFFPSDDDESNDFWWFCPAWRNPKLNDYAIKCCLANKKLVFISSASDDQFNLLPVGQKSSRNINKLQNIENLVENFPFPFNVELCPLANRFLYQDFPDGIEILGVKTEQIVVCSSTDSTDEFLLSTDLRAKFFLDNSAESQKQIRPTVQKSFSSKIRQILFYLPTKSSTDDESRRSSSQKPPPVPNKPKNFPYPSRSELFDQIETGRADGSIIFDSSSELFRIFMS